MNEAESHAFTPKSLRWHGKSQPDFSSWIKGLAVIMTKAYGQPGMLVATGKYYTYPKPDKLSAKVLDSETGEDNITKAHYLNQLGKYEELINEQSKSHFQIYSSIWEMLHPDTIKELSKCQRYKTMEESHDPLILIEELTKIMTLCSTGNIRQDKHKSRIIYNALQQRDKESVLDYYHRTEKAIATQITAGQTPDSDEEQAMDFIYKLDLKIHKAFIQKLDWDEEDAIRMYAASKKSDAAAIFVSSYPNTLEEAYQRVKSYTTGLSTTTTGIQAPHQTVFVHETQDTSPKEGKDEKEKRTRYSREEWGKMTKEQQDAAKSKNNKGRTKCTYCQKPGHTESECRALKQDILVLKKAKERDQRTIAHTTTSLEHEEDDQSEEVVYVHTTEAVLTTGGKPLSEDLVLCDHCASASIFNNKNLLRNIRPSPAITFTGIGGSIDVTQEGDFGDFGVVAYDERASFNVLSVDSLPASASVTYDHSERCHTIVLNNNTYHFKVPGGKKGLPVRKFPNTACTSVLVNTVAQNEATYTKREVDRAKIASELTRMLAYPSLKATSSALSDGVLIDCPVTIQDVQRSIAIYGVPVPSIKGKTTHTTTLPDKIITVDRPAGNKVHLDADIFYVESIPFLLSHGTPLNLLAVTCLANRTEATVRKALDAHIAMYRSHGHIVTSILLDNESSLTSLQEVYQQRGIRVTYAPPGQHVPGAERYIRLMKERCRAIIAAIPCALCRALHIALVYFVTSRINLLPVLSSRANAHAHHRMSPKELLTGIKTSYLRDLRVGFLDYAQMTEPVNETLHNTMKARTRGGVALYPLSNSKGSVRFMALDTGAEVVREKFTVLPMPDVVILHLNALAAKDKKTFSRDPTFLYHGSPVTALDDTDTDTDAHSTPDTFIPLDPEDPHSIADDLNLPSDYHDYDNRGGEPEEVTTPNDNNAQDCDISPTADIGGEERIGGVGGENDTRGDTPSHVTMPDHIIAPTAPKVKFTREPYILRQRHPARTVLTVAGQQQTTHHAYNISIKRALQSHGDSALKALFTECTSLLEKSTFHPVSKKTLTEDQLKKVIRSSCFLKEKNTAEGVFEKLKARIVAGGNQQDKTVYTLEETSSPTVSTAAVFVTAAIAAHQGRHVITMDVETAYLNAKMIEGKPVFMRLDPLITAILSQLDAEFEQFHDSKGATIVKLDRALYGCVESAVLWYKDLRHTLETDGFKVNDYDLCVFNKIVSSEQITVIFHVDDLLSACVHTFALEDLYNVLIKRYGKVKLTRGKKHCYLGMILDFATPGQVSITTPGFIGDIIAEYGTTSHATTPADDDLFVLRPSPLLSAAAAKRFHTFVAKLLYASKRTRPDILTLVAFLTTRVQSPTEDDQAKLDRGMRYIAGTAALGLTLRIEGPIRVTAYIDASFAIHADMRSHTGVYITLGLGSIYCRSSKQKLMTKSSTEAELVGISDALAQVIWFKHFLEAQGHPVTPAHIWEDNESTICLAKTGRSCSERSRHIEIRYFWIHDYLTSGQVTLQHMRTENMIADMFTKPLQGAKFKHFRSLCLNEQ